MKKYLKRRFDDALFPSFSELDPIIFMLILIIGGIVNSNSTLDWYIENFELSTALISLGFMVITFYLLKQIFSKKPIPNNVKSIIGKIYYVAIAFLSMNVAAEQVRLLMIRGSVTLLDYINIFILIFIIGRSYIQLVILKGLKDNSDKLVASRFSDRQTSITEVAFISLLSTVIFLLLIKDSSFRSAVLFTYFYSTTAANFFFSLFKKCTAVKNVF